jgi:hypothetical protein
MQYLQNRRILQMSRDTSRYLQKALVWNLDQEGGGLRSRVVGQMWKTKRIYML